MGPSSKNTKATHCLTALLQQWGKFMFRVDTFHLSLVSDPCIDGYC